MNFGKTQSPSTLAAWLTIATRGLTPAWQTRVGIEIETRYLATLQSHRAAGLSSLAAQTAALADLGDAPTLAQRLRRQQRLKKLNDFFFPRRGPQTLAQLIGTATRDLKPDAQARFLAEFKEHDPAVLQSRLQKFLADVDTNSVLSVLNIFHRPPLQNLAEWLALATQGLVPSAQSRIRTEIESHFAEAVQTHLALGSSESEAHTAALADLGDPDAAAVRFRREHLTILEVKTLESRAQSARDRSGKVYLGDLFLLPFWLVVSLFYLGDWAFAPSRQDLYVLWVEAFLLLIVSCALLNIALDVQARRKPTLATTRRIFGLGCLKTVNLTLLYGIFYASIFLNTQSVYDSLFLKFYDTWVLSLLIFCGIIALRPVVKHVFFNLRLRKKLASAHADDFPGLHPGAA